MLSAMHTSPLVIDTECEVDGRWIAEVKELPGVLAYGDTREEAVARTQALALRVLADRLEHGETVPEALIPIRSGARSGRSRWSRTTPKFH
jgi:predicted RNase H-like HicB family nuclease